MTELTCTINNFNDITSLQEIVNNNTTNITTLESYTVSSGTNFGVGPDVFDNLTTGTQKTEKITIPVTSSQVMSFTIGTGGTAGSATSVSGGDRGTTTVTMYGQTI